MIRGPAAKSELWSNLWDNWISFLDWHHQRVLSWFVCYQNVQLFMKWRLHISLTTNLLWNCKPALCQQWVFMSSLLFQPCSLSFFSVLWVMPQISITLIATGFQPQEESDLPNLKVSWSSHAFVFTSLSQCSEKLSAREHQTIEHEFIFIEESLSFRLLSMVNEQARDCLSSCHYLF